MWSRVSASLGWAFGAKANWSPCWDHGKNPKTHLNCLLIVLNIYKYHLHSDIIIIIIIIIAMNQFDWAITQKNLKLLRLPKIEGSIIKYRVPSIHPPIYLKGGNICQSIWDKSEVLLGTLWGNMSGTWELFALKWGVKRAKLQWLTYIAYFILHSCLLFTNGTAGYTKNELWINFRRVGNSRLYGYVSPKKAWTECRGSTGQMF
jgi:hypothetical protein